MDPTLDTLQRCFAFVKHVLTTPGMPQDTLDAAAELRVDLIDTIQQHGRDQTDDNGDPKDDF